MSLFYIIRYIFEKKEFGKKTGKVIENISLVTFGIYLLHFIFLSRLFQFGLMQKVFELNAYLGMFALEIACFVLCGIITYILKKIPIVKKYL